MKTKSGIFFVLTMLLAVNSWAATINVDAANTSGIEDGTPANPFNTIQEGINAAVGGDSVLVAPGIYYGAIEMQSNVPIVSAQGPEVTIIDGMDSFYAITFPYVPSPRVYIDGFTIRSNGNHIIRSTNRVDFWGGNYLEINNCILRDAIIAIAIMPISTVVVKRSVITNVQYAFHSIWTWNTNLINVTVDSVNLAFYMYDVAYALTNTSISNVNRFASSGTFGGTIGGTNNNLWKYSSLTDGIGAISVNLANTISADPLFVNAPNDYRLQSGSPLIDAGIDVGLPFSGAAPDIGAYESSAVNIPGLLNALATSISEIPIPAYKNAGEQRRNALDNKLTAVLHKLDTITDTMTNAEKRAVYQDALDKLVNDIWAKADGFYGGNPDNDWITTQTEQDALYIRIKPLIDALQAKINNL